MTTRSVSLRKWSQRLLLLLPLLLLFLVKTPQPGWTNRGTLVFFTANWCASCRDAQPIIKEIAQQNNLTVLQIDVDAADAPKQARNVGLSIPTESPPQVFCLSHGHSTLVYSATKGKGASDIQATLLQNLQKVLPQ